MTDLLWYIERNERNCDLEPFFLLLAATFLQFKLLLYDINIDGVD